MSHSYLPQYPIREHALETAQQTVMYLIHGSEHPPYQLKQRAGAFWPGHKKALGTSYQNVEVSDGVGEVRKRKPDSSQWCPLTEHEAISIYCYI